MPSIALTDLEWLSIYSLQIDAITNTVNPANAPSWSPIVVPISFDADESFSDFAIELPFVPPQLITWGSWSWDNSALSISSFSGFGSSGTATLSATISGKNTSASPITANFTFNPIVQLPLPGHS